MPTIKRKEINPKKIKYKTKKENALRFYDTAAWRRLRNTFLSTHPLCACCIEHGRVEPATDIHHIIPYDRGNSEEEKWALFLDEKNLLPLCEKCHYALHFKDKEYHLLSLDTLTDTEYNYAHGLNYLNK